ncbi:MAG TPA: response regulator [Actinomycetota bacterium]|nr:response regulator [Actinomycetota bacterium]
MTDVEASGPCRVVIADDTPDIRMLLRWSLEPDDRFEIVGEAANGVEAVDLISTQEVDAILLDLAMPVMDGLQAIPRIKDASPSTRIVVLSGFDEESMAGEAMSRGADAYLEKGVAVKEIADVLLRVWGRDVA